jgi:NAD(P)-dependent dehydrogenase (short-subunit alcohol dehydrogenase family)
MNKRLIGKCALITGASSGIGSAVAEKFAREGAKIGINYSRNDEGAEETLRKVRSAGSEGFLLKGDISDPESARTMTEKLVNTFGSIDVLVNNSGIGSGTPDRVTDIDQRDWDRVLAVNLTGAELMCKYVIPFMIKNGGGSIINVSSIRGLLGNPYLASYSTSKGGLVILTKQLACDYASEGIRVNCICPGFTGTEMFNGYLEKQDDPEGARNSFAAMAPLNRIGTPEEMADSVLFFASDNSSFITGVALPVDGGYTANGVREVL